jgi:hypothetical protein
MVKPKKRKCGGLPPTMGLVCRPCEGTGDWRTHYPIYVIRSDRDIEGDREWITSLYDYDGGKGWMCYIVDGLPVSNMTHFYLQMIGLQISHIN